MRRLWVWGCSCLVIAAAGCRPSPDGARDPGPATMIVAVAASAAAPHAASEPPALMDCGTSKCKVGTEECCPIGAGSCQPIDDLPQYCTVGEATTGSLRCDDRSDCLPGQACCWQGADSENSFASCTALPCESHEVCRSDADCGVGARCEHPHAGRLGTCERSPVPLTCGSTRCDGATPICCWNPFNPEAWCAPDHEDPCVVDAGVRGFRMQCLSPRDCGPETCCAAYGTYCRGECVNTRIVCETDKDCPQRYLDAPLSGCRASDDPQEPSWLKVCRYGS